MNDSEPNLGTAIAEAELDVAPGDAPSIPARGFQREHFLTVGAISAGGFLGANARYLVGLWVGERVGTAFPWGTLLINVSGSFVLGFYLALATERFSSRPATRLFIATGFLGAYTTFSTYSFETVQLVARGDGILALAYVSGSLVLGLAAAALGFRGAQAL